MKNSIIKIILLILGLSMGLLLIAKIWKEYNYDRSIIKGDNIYAIAVNHNPVRDKNNNTWIMGATAPALADATPNVLSASRYMLLSNRTIKNSKEDIFNNETILLTDTSFFEIFNTQILTGNPKDILQDKSSILSSKQLANKHSDDYTKLINTEIKDGNFIYFIKGVYNDFPKNSRFNNLNIIGSLTALKNYEYDGSEKWENDKYIGFVTLAKRENKELVENVLTKLCTDNIIIHKNPFKGDSKLIPFNDYYLN